MTAEVDALVAAADKGDVAKLAALLEARPGLASASRESHAGVERCPALARAAALGNVRAVALLLEHGADANAMYQDGYGTALTAACECLAPGAGDVVRLLLERGADPALADGLFVACSTYARNPAEKHRVVRLLMDTGETADQPAAVLAVHSGDAKVLSGCIARDPGALDRRYGEVDYLSWPLANGAPTLMHIAADMGETAIVQLLVASGADINARAGAGTGGCGFQTPVFHCLASYRGTGLDTLKYLISQRADLGVTARAQFPADTEGMSGDAGAKIDLKPLGLAMRFSKAGSARDSTAALMLLRAAGAVE